MTISISQNEPGKLELASHEFDLRDSIGNILHSFGLNAAEENVKLAYLIPEDVPNCLVGD